MQPHYGMWLIKWQYFKFLRYLLCVYTLAVYAYAHICLWYCMSLYVSFCYNLSLSLSLSRSPTHTHSGVPSVKKVLSSWSSRFLLMLLSKTLMLNMCSSWKRQHHRLWWMQPSYWNSWRLWVKGQLILVGVALLITLLGYVTWSRWWRR